MNNDILREIIDVEKEVQQSLDQARERTRLWLEARKQELDEDLAREEKEMTAAFQQSRERITREAADKAADLVKRAELQAAQIMRLNDGTLAAIAANHIHKILPG